MENYLDTIDELFAKYKALQPLKAEDKARLDKKFRLEFNYNSNHIEGNTLTYGETELLLMFDDTMGNHSMREYEETKAHDVAFHVVEQFAKDAERPLTEQFIKELNETILVRPYWKDAITPDGQPTRRQIKVGEYKEFPNSVRLQNGEMFHYASPAETPIKMQELIDWYRTEEQSSHPVALAAMLHYKFVRVHPFDDGNGRISRLLMNYVLLKFDYPPVIIKSADKDNYLRALHLADVGDFDAFVNYVAKQVVWSLEVSLKAANGGSLKDSDDFIKEIELLKRKASAKGVIKNAEVVYNAFDSVNRDLWTVILNALNHFDTLFAKSFNSYEIDGMSGSVDQNAPNVPLIFGIDISKRDPQIVFWRHNSISLKGVDAKVNSVITLDLKFSVYTYTVSVIVDSMTLNRVTKKYQERLLSEDIDIIENKIKDYLLKFLKEKIK